MLQFVIHLFYKRWQSEYLNRKQGVVEYRSFWKSILKIKENLRWPNLGNHAGIGIKISEINS